MRQRVQTGSILLADEASECEAGPLPRTDGPPMLQGVLSGAINRRHTPRRRLRSGPDRPRPPSGSPHEFRIPRSNFRSVRRKCAERATDLFQPQAPKVLACDLPSIRSSREDCESHGLLIGYTGRSRAEAGRSGQSIGRMMTWS